MQSFLDFSQILFLSPNLFNVFYEDKEKDIKNHWWHSCKECIISLQSNDKESSLIENYCHTLDRLDKLLNNV